MTKCSLKVREMEQAQEDERKQREQDCTTRAVDDEPCEPPSLAALRHISSLVPRQNPNLKQKMLEMFCPLSGICTPKYD